MMSWRAEFRLPASAAAVTSKLHEHWRGNASKNEGSSGDVDENKEGECFLCQAGPMPSGPAIGSTLSSLARCTSLRRSPDVLISSFKQTKDELADQLAGIRAAAVAYQTGQGFRRIGAVQGVC